MREAQLAVDEVHDLFAFRVIVPTVSDCYLALTAVHSVFEPEPFRFKDYIETPKPNGYRSLHTSVRDNEARLFEVQIRTPGHARQRRERTRRALEVPQRTMGIHGYAPAIDPLAPHMAGAASAIRRLTTRTAPGRKIRRHLPRVRAESPNRCIRPSVPCRAAHLLDPPPARHGIRVPPLTGT